MAHPYAGAGGMRYFTLVCREAAAGRYDGNIQESCAGAEGFIVAIFHAFYPFRYTADSTWDTGKAITPCCAVKNLSESYHSLGDHHSRAALLHLHLQLPFAYLGVYRDQL